ncbi:MAG: VOC family protein [Rhodocyclaceae bacterium]|nr:VOC family protein [Rhodocyclaceae bacterium]
MNGILGLYEVALPVRDLARAADFHRALLGFEVVHADDQRRWLFLRLGDAAMLVLQQEDAPRRLHLALRVAEDQLGGWRRRIANHGIAVEGPIELPWIPARSLYFSDPDGHELELIALDGRHREHGR